MAKKLHWTRRPENKGRVRDIMAKASSARKNCKQPTTISPIVGEIRQLEAKAVDRLKVIDTLVETLTNEAKEIRGAFPQLSSELLERLAVNG